MTSRCVQRHIATVYATIEMNWRRTPGTLKLSKLRCCVTGRYGRSCYVAIYVYAVLSLADLLSAAVADAANLPSLYSHLRRWPPLQQVSLFLSLFLSLSRWTRSRLANGDLISSLLTWEIYKNSANFSPDFSCEFFLSFHMRFWHEKSGEFSGEISPEKSPEIFQSNRIISCTCIEQYFFTLRAQSVRFAHACLRKRTGKRHFAHAVLKNNVRPSRRSGDKPTFVPKSFLSHLYRK